MGCRPSAYYSPIKGGKQSRKGLLYNLPSMPKKVVFIGSHLGYAMEKTPLGGGAMVGLQLIRHWAAFPGVELVALGSGPVVPHSGVEYVQAPAGTGLKTSLVNLSELGYARFCRAFEKQTTDWLLERLERFDPRSTVVVVNDISEGPDLKALTAKGFPVVSLWHVDVVDYFNKLYLRNFVRPERLTALYERSRRLGMHWIVPDVLKLVFEKQRATVAHSRRMILPSRAMAETVERCYGDIGAQGESFQQRAVVIPWGMWAEDLNEQTVERGVQRLRGAYGLGPASRVVMTLSRIAPEKGIHLLLEGLRLLELEPGFALGDLHLLLCGEPAFMKGASYMRKVKAAAAALRRVKVHFTGYLAPPEKAMHFRLAHLFVSPSIHESYGLNIVEAMRAGLPILASDHYGVRDTVRPEFGVAVHYPSPAKAPALLARGLKDLLADPRRLAVMGKEAKSAAAAMPFSEAAKKVMDTATELLK